MRKISLLWLITITLWACQSQPSPTVEDGLTQIEATPPAPTVGVGTPTLTPTATATGTPVPSPTPQTPPMPLPTPLNPLIDYYVVEAGDTLSGISFAYDIPIDDLMALNGLTAEDFLQQGQTLHVPLQIDRTGPLTTLLPDSEVVYSPAYRNFEVETFIQEQGGYLATYSARVNGRELSAAEIVTLVAERFSVGPRVLLAVTEYYSGWVTNPNPELFQPGGPLNPYADNLYLQLGWAANRINEGYYNYKRSGSTTVRFRDGTRAVIPSSMNAGSVGLQNLLAVNSNWDDWLTEVNPQGFMQTYRQLFGDPFQYAVEPLIPSNLTQPPLTLPWEVDSTFYYTGGPHPAYGEGSAWAAVDFGPPDVLGSCFYSGEYITAVADGTLILNDTGEFYLDLDNDGDLRTGWVILYLHVITEDGLTTGQTVTAGTPLGFASCEGGIANSSHLHLARRYQGEWLAAAEPVPFNLSGWEVKGGLGPYEGGMVRNTNFKTACECWDETENAITRE